MGSACTLGRWSMRSAFLLGVAVGALGGVGVSLLYLAQEADVEATLPVPGDSMPVGPGGIAREQSAEPKPRMIAKAKVRPSTRDPFSEAGYSDWEEVEQPPSVPDDAEIVDPELEQELQRLSDETYDALDELAALGPEAGLSKEQLDSLYEAEDQRQKSLDTEEDLAELTLEQQIDGTLSGLREGGASDEVIEHFLATLDSVLEVGAENPDSGFDSTPPPPPPN